MSAGQRPLLLGHRGARAVKTIPENTIASFDRCMADGCDGFEFDVRLTADGVAVVCHDAEVKGGEIARAAAGQLAGLARFEEVFARYHEGAFLDLELKVAGLEKIVAGLLKKNSARRFVVSSFLPEVLQTLRAEDPGIPLGLICETRAELGRWEQLGVDYVIPQHRLVDRALLDRLRTAGEKILVWTVNGQAEMRRFADWGVDGIISDDTKLLVRTLA